MKRDILRLCDTIRNTAYQVHVRFMPGYLEKVYENALAHRLLKLGLDVRQNYPITINDEDGFIVGSYFADLLVESCLIVELKAVSTLVPIHEMQLINYLHATGIRHGMLINFGSEKFQCLKRVIETNNKVIKNT
ncbi:MAG: GxxExxY protein [Victivallales bacterium]|nr:GxxExxY protein [Victivallales bacterium]